MTYPGELRRAEARRVEALVAAAGLAERLRAGEPLPPINSSVRLDVDEVAYLETTAEFSQYYGSGDATYEHVRVFGGGLGMLALSSIGNANRRREAEAAAAPQWHSFGTIPLVATNWRVLGCDQGRWLSWWYRGVRQAVPHLPAAPAVDLLFDESRPTRFTGETVPLLAVALVHLLYGETLVWDGAGDGSGQMTPADRRQPAIGMRSPNPWDVGQ